MGMGVVFIFLSRNAETIAQNAGDALLWSSSTQPSHARPAGMLNASGAAGAMAVPENNPAGLGLYRNSEVSGGFGFHSITSNTQYLGNRFTDFDDGYVLPHLSVIYHEPTSGFGSINETGWVSNNMGFTFNRRHSFRERNILEGVNNTSITSAYAERARGIHEDMLPLVEFMAWELFLIDNPEGNDQYEGVFESYEDPENARLQQSREMHRSGHSSDFSLSWAGNYSNWLYPGLSLQFLRLNYKHQSVFTERNASDSINIYRGMQFEESVHTKGLAVRFQGGVIVAPYPFLRAGIGFSSPATYRLEEKNDYYMSSESTDQGFEYTEITDSEWEFNYRIPAELSGMLTFIAPNLGMLSIDVMTRNPANMRLNADQHSYRTENQLISDAYQRTYRIRTGAEKIAGPFALRGGYSYTTSPIHIDYRYETNDGIQRAFSAGTGFRIGDYSVDLAWMRTLGSTVYQPYYLADQTVHPAQVASNSNHFLLSLGYRF